MLIVILCRFWSKNADSKIRWASAPVPVALTHFTVSSANDVPNRDPRVWFIEGSNDGSNWTTIFEQNDPSQQVWDQRLQVIRFDAGTDFPVQAQAFSMFRMRTTATGATSGAFFQVGEIEFFADFHPPHLIADFNEDDVVDLADFEILRANFFQTVSDRSQGDVNFDGVVDYHDFRLWKDNRTDLGVAAAAAVPEPSCALLAVVLTGACLVGRRRIARLSLSTDHASGALPASMQSPKCSEPRAREARV